MISKIKNWLSGQKKDIKTLLISFVIFFVLNLIVTLNVYHALGAGLGWAFFVAIVINAIRFWRSIARKVGAPIEGIHIDLEGEEKVIFNDMISLPNIKELSLSEEIDETIKEKILSKKYCKEEYQIHYAKERIKIAIIKQIN